MAGLVVKKNGGFCQVHGVNRLTALVIVPFTGYFFWRWIALQVEPVVAVNWWYRCKENEFPHPDHRSNGARAGARETTVGGCNWKIRQPGEKPASCAIWMRHARIIAHGTR